MNVFVTQNNLTPEAMKDLVLQSDKSLEMRMAEVANQISKLSDLRLIGLTGPTCSGKTTTARLLTEVFEKCGRRVHVVSIDDFYYDKEVLHARADADPEVEIDYDSEETIDVDLLAEKAESLLAGKETKMPKFDFHSGSRVDGVTVTPRPDDVFLFEGIQILYPKVDAILRKQNYRSIYIRPASSVRIENELFEPNELRLMRRLVRDYLYRSTDPEFTFYVWQSVRDNEEKSIFPYSHSCNYFIDSTMPYEVGMLKPYLERILAKISKESKFYNEAAEVLRQLQHVQPIPSAYMTPNSLYKEFI
jgi:uridine kinase